MDEKAVHDVIKVLVHKSLLKNTPTTDSNSYYIKNQDQENITILERGGKEAKLWEKLPTLTDCDPTAIKSPWL